MANYVRAKPDNLRTWFVENGIFPLIAAIGYAMTGLLNFWVGIILTVAASIFFARDLWNCKQRWAAAGVAAFIIVFLVMAFKPAPLVAILETPSGNYPTDREYYGVEWKTDYYPMNLVLSNGTDDDYEKFDLFVRASDYIARVGIDRSDTTNNCVAILENPEIDFILPELSAGGTTIPLFGKGENTASPIYRLRCDKIGYKSKVNFVFAMQSKPTWAILQTSYRLSSGRVLVKVFRQCFVQACPAMPLDLW